MRCPVACLHTVGGHTWLSYQPSGKDAGIHIHRLGAGFCSCIGFGLGLHLFLIGEERGTQRLHVTVGGVIDNLTIFAARGIFTRAVAGPSDPFVLVIPRLALLLLLEFRRTSEGGLPLSSA